jgi:hypothetical protein
MYRSILALIAMGATAMLGLPAAAADNPLKNLDYISGYPSAEFSWKRTDFYLKMSPPACAENAKSIEAKRQALYARFQPMKKNYLSAIAASDKLLFQGAGAFSSAGGSFDRLQVKGAAGEACKGSFNSLLDYVTKKRADIQQALKLVSGQDKVFDDLSTMVKTAREDIQPKGKCTWQPEEGSHEEPETWQGPHWDHIQASISSMSKTWEADSMGLQMWHLYSLLYVHNKIKADLRGTDDDLAKYQSKMQDLLSHCGSAN